MGVIVKSSALSNLSVTSNLDKKERLRTKLAYKLHFGSFPLVLNGHSTSELRKNIISYTVLEKHSLITK